MEDKQCVFVNSTDQSVLVALNSDEGNTHLQHFSTIGEAIENVETLLAKLRQAIPLDDWSGDDVTDMIEALGEEFSLPPRGLEGQVRMKWTKSTTNFHVYDECCYDNALTEKSHRKVGSIYINRSCFPDDPPLLLDTHFKPTESMQKERQSE
jgi:hypothetical protein